MVGLVQVIVSQEIPAIKTNMVTFVPEYMINHGVRIDYEFSVSPKNWIVLCPQLYLNDKTSSDPNNPSKYNELYGAGFFAYYKKYLEKDKTDRGLYLSYGVTYNYYYISASANDNGSILDGNTTINKVAAEMQIGYHYRFKDFVVFDFYTGLCEQHSFKTYGGNVRNNYNNSFIDFGYSGSMMLLGMKFGFCY